MVDVTRAFESASRHVEPTWDDQRLQAGERQLVRRVRRRRVVRRTVAVVGMLALVAGFTAVWRGRAARLLPERETIAALEDGSRAQIFAGAELGRATDNDARQQKLEVRAGRVRFDVTHRRDRRLFWVAAGEVTVEVVGTAFTVERHGAAAQVAVHEGVVRVRWPGGLASVRAGESGLFPPPQPTGVAPAEAAPTGAEAAPKVEGPTGALPANAAAAGVAGSLSAAPSAPVPSSAGPPKLGALDDHEPAEAPSAAKGHPTAWRPLARAGHYDRAYVELRRAGPTAVRDEAGDLLSAADVARLSGHPREALPHLERVLARHRADPRAPLAAFTLGRVLLEELHDPAAAARAFGLARQLDAHSPLMDDVLRREVEAWARAGQRDQAQAAARLYLERFPKGESAAQVRALSGLR